MGGKKTGGQGFKRKKKLKIEHEKLKVVKLEAELKRQQAETEQIRARIEFMERLKNLGHTQEEIAWFFAEQFGNRGGGSNLVQSPVGSDEDSSNDSDSS